MTRAPSRAAVSAKVVSGFASGSRMAVRNMARPARPKLRSRSAAVSCGEATGVEVVLITVRSGGVYCFSIARRKSKIISWRLGVFETVDFAHAGEGAADVRDGDGATDDQCDVEGVDDLVALPAFFAAAHEMVGDAIVAAQDGGGYQAEEFLGFGAKRAGLVGLKIGRAHV